MTTQAETTTTTRKAICRELDAAAERALCKGLEPATSRQCWFLAGLMLEAGQDEVTASGFRWDDVTPFTKRFASKMISSYLREKNRKND